MNLNEKELDILIKEEIQNMSDETSLYPMYHKLLKVLGPETLLEELIAFMDKEILTEALNKIDNGRKLLKESVGKKVKHLHQKNED